MFIFKTKFPVAVFAAYVFALMAVRTGAADFEGRIRADFTRGGGTEPWLYTVATNLLRVEITGSTQPNPINVLDRTTSQLTLLFPHNRSFLKLKTPTDSADARPPGMPIPMPMPAPPPPGAIGPTNLPGVPTPPAMPRMPTIPASGGMMPPMPMMPMPGENLELTATGEKTNLLGYACEKFEIKQRGEVMEIWATKDLLPFQNYVRNQPHRFGPRMIEERWGDLLTAKKMFPLRAVLKFENGPERLRFEVQSVTAETLKPEDAALFAPPPEYQEIQPLPF